MTLWEERSKRNEERRRVWEDTKKIVISRNITDIGKSIKYTSPEVKSFSTENLDTSVKVLRMDTIDAAKLLCSVGYNPILLNMADPYEPGGNVDMGDSAQEENLFRRSNLFLSLDKYRTEIELKESKRISHISIPEELYPLKKYEVIYTAGVRFFKENEELNYKLNFPGFNCAVISCAALNRPRFDIKRQRFYEKENNYYF